MTDNDLDALLNRPLPMIPGGDFPDRIEAQLARRRMRDRWALSAAILVCATALIFIPAPRISAELADLIVHAAANPAAGAAVAVIALSLLIQRAAMHF